MPGCVVIQNGQEFGEDYWLMDDDKGSNRRVKPRPLRWDFTEDLIGGALTNLYARLIGLRKNHAALRSDNFYPSNWPPGWTQFNEAGYGVQVDKQVVIFHRWAALSNGKTERFIIVLNFSDQDQDVDVPFSENGTWQDLLNGGTIDVTGFYIRGYRLSSN